jgi:hypothetical protein
MDRDTGLTERQPLPDNTSFLRALDACGKAYSPRTRETLYRELLHSTLLLPVGPPQGTGRAGRAVAADGQHAKFMTRHHPETGEEVVFVFTDVETMAAYELAEADYLVVPARDIMQRLAGARGPSLIVCAQDAHLPISHTEIVQLAGGKIPPPHVQAIASPQLRADQLTFMPLEQELPERVRRLLQQRLERSREIEAVYVFRLHNGTAAPGVAAGVIFATQPDEQSIRTWLDAVAQVIKPEFPQEEQLVVLPLPRYNRFARELMQGLTACYQR